jgi:hypothetical protein
MILSISITVFWLVLLLINHCKLTAIERQLAQTNQGSEASRPGANAPNRLEVNGNETPPAPATPLSGQFRTTPRPSARD